jgi:SAM-dependent methyltransferase
MPLCTPAMAGLWPSSPNRWLRRCGPSPANASLTWDAATTLVGVDNSPQMVAAAKERGADARYASGESLSFNQEFDAVFSNAALHWMSDQDAVLRGVYRALKPGGRFVAECGGQGNIAAIRVALLAVLTAHGIPPARIENNRFFGIASGWRARASQWRKSR